MTNEQIVSEGVKKVTEAAEFLQVSRTTVYHLMDSGQLPYVKIGKSRRVPVVALHRLAADCLRGVEQGQ